MMMRLAVVVSTLLLCLVVLAHSWTSTYYSTKRSLITMMGSRQATKWEKKKEWLDNRGFTLDGRPKTAMAEIIGSGRIGSLLQEAGYCKVIGREDSIDPNGEGPILIATRNDALDGIIDSCPENRRKDLVFMQNGYLDEYLESKGLLENTQVLLYLSVTAVGADPIDGITSVNPEGLTKAVGLHANAFKDRLAELDLKCEVVTPEEYKPAMFEKLIWICTYMLVGTAKGCSSVGQAGSEHAGLVEKVVKEMVAAVSEKEGIEFAEGTMERLAAYTEVVSDFPCAVKEFEWRNKYFFNLGDEACPTHNQLLRECAEKGLLKFDLPSAGTSEQDAEPQDEPAGTAPDAEPQDGQTE